MFTLRTYLSSVIYHLGDQWLHFCLLFLVFTFGSILLSFTLLNHCLDTGYCIWSIYPNRAPWEWVCSIPDGSLWSHWGYVMWICFCLTLRAGRWLTWPRCDPPEDCCEVWGLTKPGMFLSSPSILADLSSKEELTVQSLKPSNSFSWVSYSHLQHSQKPLKGKYLHRVVFRLWAPPFRSLSFLKFCLSNSIYRHGSWCPYPDSVRRPLPIAFFCSAAWTACGVTCRGRATNCGNFASVPSQVLWSL